MQLIARQFNLSETTFVCPPTNPRATWRLRSFLPNGEEVFGVGHNSLGAWWWMAHAGLIYQQQLGDDILLVEVSVSTFRISMRQGSPQFLDKHTNQPSLAESLGLDPCEIGLQYSGTVLEGPQVVTSSPARHLLVPVRSKEALYRVKISQQECIAQELARTRSYNSGLYVLTSTGGDSTVSGTDVPRFEAPFFSPGMSMEDPVDQGRCCGASKWE
ncbi:hypothetical protein NUU61_000459 [Penicillium alfredii]|uniref:Uncharacterized protein n=1 Tax=Penicillium alfredii TaxID=1506179 RepID=A0A9W9G9L1_9EURO|nr:uncharacterized protein NUU61_000459 [Penicillium alfredii]KAJ5114700.1 hypothetical protein NUU61_000459 [Penicillium alfredii]